MEEEGIDAVIRRARPGDVGPIVGLWREMWDAHTPLDPRFPPPVPHADAVVEAWIRQHLESDRSAVFVAEAGGGLDGYCLAMVMENPPVVPSPTFGYVSEISVRRRRRGTGGRLLEAVHGWLRSLGVVHVEVNVSVRNPAARSFWRRQGYGDFLERLRREL